MASSLEDDLSCPVCCEVYKDPQLLSCGHSFCRGCLDKHWAVSSARSCPVCRSSSQQKPVANLVLRNTCESYLKEKDKERENEVRCSQHGEKISFFCKTDEKAICSECRRYSHSSHKVQPLIHAVRQRKSRVKAALHPAEKALEVLKKGTTVNSQIIKYIESQAEQAEQLMKKEFEHFHQFLRKEEEARVASLKKEADRKREKVQKKIDRELRSLSEKIKEVEEEMENDGATFLQNFDSALKRAEYTEPDTEFSSENLINMAEHVGNLGYKVWEKMTNNFRYYPVVLEPNSASADVFVSDDLICAGQSKQDCSNPVAHRGNCLVLGSEGFTEGNHCWDIEVGNNKHWTIGVCQRSADMYRVKPMTHEGFWGLSRKGDTYRLLDSRSDQFRIKKKLRMVRVQLGWWYSLDNLNTIWTGRRMLSFLDAGDDSLIAYTRVPSEVALFPFLIPEERFGSPLRIAPVNVAHTVGHILPLEQNNKKDLIFAILLAIACLIIGMLTRKE